MNPKAIINELRRINAWRRGDETIEQPEPEHFGDVLDAAAILIEQTDARCIEREERIEQMGAAWDKTKTDLARVTAERDHLKSLVFDGDLNFSNLTDEYETLRARVAELEEDNTQYGADFRAQQKKLTAHDRELAKTTAALKLTKQLRDRAEQRNAEMVAAFVSACESSDSAGYGTLTTSFVLAVINEARAEFATPAKQEDAR